MSPAARWEGRWLWIAGTLAGPQPGLDAAWLAALPAGARPQLDLADLDVDDGVAVTFVVDAIRALRARGPVTVRAAPQMVAHTLYKVGDLRSGGIVLVAPREDEGTTAN